MEPSYDEDSVPVEGDAQGKIAPAQARYRKGSPVRCCGLCVHYEGAANGTCRAVAGAITPYGVSDSFVIAPNPFGPMLGPRERSIVNEMVQSPPDASRFAGSSQPAVSGASAPEGAPTGPGALMPQPSLGPAAPASPAQPMEEPPRGMQWGPRMRIGRQAY